MHLGNLLHCGASGHAHNLADLGGHRLAAGGAGIDWGHSLDHSGGIAGAAGIAAAATVGAGQAAQDGLFTGIHLNSEHLGAIARTRPKMAPSTARTTTAIITVVIFFRPP